MIIIREALLKDKLQVIGLYHEFIEYINTCQQKPNHPWTHEEVTKQEKIFDSILENPDYTLFVAESELGLLGLASVFLLPKIGRGSYYAHIEEFVITKKYRRQGVGTSLFNTIKTYCKNRGIQTIKLDSGLAFPEAHAFYEKNGGVFTEKMYRFDLENL
jgi:GNAT superfamily N-acetyltransferase